jgi:hypothetical protein
MFAHVPLLKEELPAPELLLREELPAFAVFGIREVNAIFDMRTQEVGHGAEKIPGIG